MNRLPRVLYMIQRYRPIYTGAGIQIENICTALAGRGMELLMATMKAPGAPEFEDGTVPVRRFNLPIVINPVLLWWRNRDFTAFLKASRDRFDILHVVGNPPVIPFVIPTAKRNGWGTVITSTLLNSDDPLTIRGMGRLSAFRFNAYRKADAFIGFCPAQVDTYVPAGIPVERVHHIPNGVDMERFSPAEDPKAAARDVGWDPDRPRVFFAGGWLHRKGIDVLLDAWLRVLEAVPLAQLYMAGPTDLPEPDAHPDFAAQKLREVEDPRFKGSVHVLGNQSDVSGLYRAADVFAFPSRNEGFPNVVLESLASGTPAVVTRIPGSTDESVRHGVNGFVVEQEDSAALAERTIELLADPAKLREFSRAARADAEKRYAMSLIADRHLKLYEDVLSEIRG